MKKCSPKTRYITEWKKWTVKWPLSLETFLKRDFFRISLNTLMPRYAMRSFTFWEPSTIIATMSRDCYATHAAMNKPSHFIAAEKREERNCKFRFPSMYHATNRSFCEELFARMMH